MAADEVAELDVDAPVEEDHAPVEPQTKLGAGSKKLKILALLAVVMVGEAGAMYFFVPNGEHGSVESAEAGEGADGAVESRTSGQSVEGDIGQFNVTNSVADPASTIHISFTLSAIVPAAKAGEFENAVGEVHKGRIRQAVLTVVRSAGLEELNDASLVTMKRLLREEVRKVLNTSYISEVVISDFKTMEQ